MGGIVCYLTHRVTQASRDCLIHLLVVLHPRRLLEKFKIFNLLYHLSAMRSRDDLIIAMITNLDYAL